MAIEAYPVGADSGFSEESAINSERDRLITAAGGRMSDHIVDPFTAGHFDESHSGSSLDITIDTGGTGKAFLGGHLVVNTASITLTLDAGSTNEIFLVVRDGATGNAEVVFTSDGSTPSGLYVMKIWEASTDSSGVTGTTDFRQWVPFRSDQANRNITGRQTGETSTQSVDSTGTFSTTVTLPQEYRDSIDQARAWLKDLSDTAVSFGFIRVTNVTTSSIDIQYNIDNAGGTGTTATFGWETHGK
jgi:hypothetical protein